MYSGNYIPTGRSYSCRQVGACMNIYSRVRAEDASLPITIPSLHADASVSQLPYSVCVLRLGQHQCCVIGLLAQQYLHLCFVTCFVERVLKGICIHNSRCDESSESSLLSTTMVAD